jgi:hypothetical protein
MSALPLPVYNTPAGKRLRIKAFLTFVYIHTKLP